MITLSKQQSVVLDAISRWLKSGEDQFFYLAGYAGTGKTTLARRIEEMVDGRVMYMAYTGKAALAMKQRGIPDPTTIHRAIYKPFVPSAKAIEDLQVKVEQEKDPILKERLERELKRLKKVSKPVAFSLNGDSDVREAKALVLDEVSMVNEPMAEDILSFGVKTLVLGDPAQLPPVKGVGYFSQRRPNAFLTEIHRQAEDNPIIRLATMAREGKAIPFGEYGEGVRKVRKHDLTKDDYTAASQILTGFNESRRGINRFMRRHRGLTTLYPSKGDKLVCLRNNYDEGLLNGLICEATIDAIEEGPANIIMSVRHELGASSDLDVYRGHFDAYASGPDEIDPFAARRYQEFDYGYALTVHKSQGSEWPSILLADDGFASNDWEMRGKWLYTAITRASKGLTIAA
jgi:exodeoxyribonuclease-5